MPVRPLIAAVALLLLPLFAASFSSSVHVSVPVALLGMCVVSAVRPAIGLGLLAALLPAGGVLAALTDSAPLGEALLAGTLIGAGLRSVVQVRPQAISPWITAASAMFALVLLASGAVQLWVIVSHVPDEWRLAEILLTDLPGDYLTGRRVFRELGAVLLLVQGAALVPLAAGVASESRARRWLHTGLVAGTTLLAAHAVYRVVEIASRADHFGPALLDAAATLRVSPSIADLNAAGSVLALGLLLSFGLPAIARDRRTWLIPLLLFTGLWLSGSRMALAAVVCTFAISWIARRLWWRSIAAVAAAVVIVATLHLVRPSGNPSSAMTIRVELAKVALQITATAPWFGVGVGEFYGLSGQFASPVLKRFYARENAHNNFLQLLAETGIAGLGAFLALLAAIMIPAFRQLQSRDDPPVRWTLMALTAYLLTCLGGHPLLSMQSAVPLWLALGLLAGAVAYAPRPADRRNRRWTTIALVPAAAALFVVASVPVRARAAADAQDLEHRGLELSRWRTDARGTRFRTFAGQGAVFAPVSLRGVELGLRLNGRSRAPEASVEVRLALEGLTFATVEVVRGQWRYVTFAVPARGETRFRRIDLESRWVPERPGARPPVIQLTKVTER